MKTEEILRYGWIWYHEFIIEGKPYRDLWFCESPMLSKIFHGLALKQLEDKKYYLSIGGKVKMENKQRTENKKEIVKKLRKLLREQKDFNLTHYDMILRIKTIIKEEE